ncbi:MAG: metal-dependent hydrolase [Saprospirales bacterium]|nr:metal-dependent hydrolase [Saprospirales bacterium]
MASVFGHIAASSALGWSFLPQKSTSKALLLAGFCAFIPDADVLAFRFGIPYHSIWGHRGWSHSLSFALGFGLLIAWLFYRQDKQWWKMALWFVAATASHPLLDMLTTGGMGCALWWPWSTERLFFPVRLIRVSPLEVRDFFSKWGMRILLSEVLWIGIPSILLIGLSWVTRRTLVCIRSGIRSPDRLE